MVGTGRGGFVGDVDGGLGGWIDGGGEGRDGGGYRLRKWENNVENLTLWMETYAPLAYDPGLELHHRIMIMLGEPGGKLDR